ncbi:LysM peptidoglycan-binding domain-containing protein [Cytobacillus gottheilii]|uniref:LysM peptidoglycan-binding domain-containing protein n=1 Tax=Cytobacillus gottheilii TaxID=859144 RepID=UPI0009BC0F2B|nr:LysM peptidoglycan-binding domain-containing protein [Cytobacillus gottheilii]
MNREGPYRDQAERLRKKITKKAGNHTNALKEELPPRSRVHRNKKANKGLKLKYPVIRLLALFFILLPIIIFTVYTYVNGGDTETTTASTGYEMVGYGNNDENENDVVYEIDEQINESNDEQTEADKPQDENPVEEEEPVEQPSESVPANEAEQEQKTNQNNNSAAKTNEPKNEGAEDENKQNSEQAEGKIVYHTVKAKETLYRVSMNYYSSADGVEIIKQANGLSSNEIQAGQVLKIPLNQ